ncbi:MAG: PAS domain S-box protein [Candidatus Zixiibacteriota bacterium]|nr:MAG: PAS domain S-box protein [candidate division Zixibacteria bacterium]
MLSSDSISTVRDLQRKLAQLAGDLADGTPQSPEQQSTLRARLHELLQELEASSPDLHRHDGELAAARAALEEERRRYLELFEFAPAGYLVTDAEGAIQEANRRLGALFNLPPSQLTGRDLADFVCAGDRQRFQERVQGLAQGRETQVRDWDLSLCGHGGRVFFGMISVERINGADGHPSGLRWVVQDVTGRKRMEEALRSGEERLRLTADAAELGVWHWDLRADKVMADARVKRLLGLAPETTVTVDLLRGILPPGDLEKSERAVRRALIEGKDFIADFRLVWPDGTPHWVQARGRAIQNREGQPIFLTGVLLCITARKQAEEERERLLSEIARQREFLEKLVSTAPVGIVVVGGPEHRYEMVNAAYQAILGVPDEAMTGRTIAEVFPAEAARAALDLVEMVHQTGAAFSAREYEVNMGPGRERTWWDVDGIPFKDANGDILSVLLLTRDATESVLARRQVEELMGHIERERRFFQRILDAIPVAVTYLDRDLIYRHCNAAAARDLEKPLEQIIGCRLDEVTAENSAIVKAVQSVLQTGKPYPFPMITFCSPHNPREEHHYLISYLPDYDDSGRVVGVFAEGQDVTGMVRAEEQLRESNERLQAVLSSITEAYFALDAEWRFVEINPVAEQEIFHRLAGELIGKVYWEEFPQIVDSEFQCRYIGAVQENQPVHFEAKSRLTTGKWFEIHAYPRGGRLEVYARDITDRKRAEELTRAALLEKETLLKEIHHRIKNNLQIVYALLNLQSRNLKPENVQQALKDSQNRVKSIALIHEKLYRSEDLSHINFADYIQVLTTNLMRSFGAETRGVALDLEADPVFLNVDTALPCSLLLNELLTNCLRHAFPGERPGRIQVKFHRVEPEKLTLSVRDDGVGLPPDLDYRRTESLGLQLVNTLAQQLGGTLEVSSDGGTEVRLAFPPSRQTKGHQNR